jgi:hypothetical protein
MNLNRLLMIGLLAWQEYQKARDAIAAAGDPTDPNTSAVLSDAELAQLLVGDAQALQDKVDALIAKHGG